jgi:uncharacterized protein (TIGR02271 family)
MRWDRNSVQEGMIVTSTTGDRIGKVIRCDAETFIVEKGALFPKDYQLRYDHITGTSSDGSLVYTLSDELGVEARRPATEAAATRPSETVAEASAARESRAEARESRAEASMPMASAPIPTETAAEGDHEVRIPLLREELDVEKYAYESGRVRIHKGVKVEERHFTVPVRREEVVVEHISTKDWAPDSERGATEASSAFQDQDLDIPLYEEDIRVGKHSVVREEFVVRTIAHAVDVEGSASLRSEEANIEDTRTRPGLSARGGNGSSAGYGAPGRH